MRTVFWVLLAAAVCCVSVFEVSAEEEDNRLAKGVQDNSFLIEEAYNQEANEVQHVVTLQRQGRDWFFNFSQEWPIGSQAHQFSYAVPYSWLRLDDRRVQGFGDVEVNYRYQAAYETARTPAIALLAGLILPNGNADRELGTGALGAQTKLAVSKIVSDRVTVHANAGVTSYFDVQGKQPTSFLLGGSVIYAVTREFNLMLEMLGEREESVNALREIERETSFTLNPGFRYAFNLVGGQLVVGAAAPIRFTNEMTDVGAFLYLSFEHKFLK
jgi:hypothetical protein